MAQVKKLKKGSIIKAQEGTLTIGTKSLSGDTALERILKAANTTDPTERVFFSGAANAIRDGMDVVYDPINYTMDVYDSNNNNVTGQYLNTAVRASDSRFKKTWDATVGNQRDKDRRSAVAFAKVNMDEEDAKPEAALPELEGGNNRWFVYEKDKDGNWIYSQDSPTNLSLQALISNAKRYVSDEAFRNQYAKTGWTQPWLKAYENAVANNQDWNTIMSNIEDRIQHKGTLDASDKEWLKILGIVEPSTDGTGGTKEDDTKIVLRAPKDSGIDVSYLPDDVRIEKGNDGRLHIIGGNNWDEDWFLGGMDAFKSSPYAAGFVVDRTLYTPQEALNITTGALGDKFTQWFNSGKISDYGQRYNAFRNSGFRFINDEDANPEDEWYGSEGSIRSYDVNRDYNPYFHSYFNNDENKGYGYFQAINTGNPDYQVIMVPGKYTPEQGFSSRYLWYNPETGNMETIASSEADFNIWAANHELSPIRGEFSGYYPVSDWQNGYNGQYAVAATINSDSTGENTIVIDRNGRYWLSRKDSAGNFTRPQRIKDQENAKKIVYNAQLRDELAKLSNAELKRRIIGPIIPQGIQNPVQETETNNDGYYHPTSKKQGGNIPT